MRLLAYKAVANPAYICQTVEDPIMEAFNLSYELDKAASFDREFYYDYKHLSEVSLAFTLTVNLIIETHCPRFYFVTDRLAVCNRSDRLRQNSRWGGGDLETVIGIRPLIKVHLSATALRGALQAEDFRGSSERATGTILTLPHCLYVKTLGNRKAARNLVRTFYYRENKISNTWTFTEGGPNYYTQNVLVNLIWLKKILNWQLKVLKGNFLSFPKHSWKFLCDYEFAGYKCSKWKIPVLLWLPITRSIKIIQQNQI